MAASAPAGVGLAAYLYRNWFTACLPQLDELPAYRYGRPLAGVYRSAHAGSGRRSRSGGLQVVNRQDVLGGDGWWRTWGGAWTPPLQRRSGVRLVLSPRPDRLAAAVRTITGALLDSDVPWSLTCATTPRRVRRTGAMVVDLRSIDDAPDGLLAALAPALLPHVPPLALPLGRGAALAGHPGNGLTFGEQRCRLIALAIRRAAAADPLPVIATVFAAHGIDPARPYRCAR